MNAQELIDLAKDVVQAEREEPEEVHEDAGKAALTELFEEVKNTDTPVIVDRVVADIDSIVRQVRFPGWQRTEAGERERLLAKIRQTSSHVVIASPYMEGGSVKNVPWFRLLLSKYK